MVSVEGLEWPDDYKTRMMAKPLAPWLTDLLPKASAGAVYVLEVGAGPITVTGTFLPDRNVRLTAVDPLAHRYGPETLNLT